MFLESKLIRAAILSAIPLAAWGQASTTIYLANPSFEGTAGAGINIPGWQNCGPILESPPDLQPGWFNVTTAPRNGNTYLGLVVRSTGTWESVGQRLNQPLEVKQCYEFSLDLRRDTSYESPLGKDKEKLIRFTSPARIIIWGGQRILPQRRTTLPVNSNSPPPVAHVQLSPFPEKRFLVSYNH